MFHKDKRRRRFLAFAPTAPGASSIDGLFELSRIASSFEPARYELLNDRPPEAFPDRDEAPPPRPHTISEAPTGGKIFYFGCYPSATRFYFDQKTATPAASPDEAAHPKD